jgi:hypothetical protein
LAAGRFDGLAPALRPSSREGMNNATGPRRLGDEPVRVTMGRRRFDCFRRYSGSSIASEHWLLWAISGPSGR